MNPAAKEETSDKRIEISEAEMAQMAQKFQTTWRRQPNDEELTVLIDSKVREHILVQEALSLSLDQNDAVIRQRLAQKMTFLITSAAGALTPSESDLRGYFEENSEQYASEPKLAFQQVFLAEQQDQAAFDEALSALNSGADPVSIGQRSMLPAEIRLSTRPAVDGMFGRGVFDAVLTAPTGTWHGPIQSGFGYHAVFVTELVQGELPEFAAVQDAVISDYREGKAQELTEEILKELRASYDVVLPDQAARDAITQ